MLWSGLLHFALLSNIHGDCRKTGKLHFSFPRLPREFFLSVSCLQPQGKGEHVGIKTGQVLAIILCTQKTEKKKETASRESDWEDSLSLHLENAELEAAPVSCLPSLYRLTHFWLFLFVSLKHSL
jgi:hypothetical protein